MNNYAKMLLFFGQVREFDEALSNSQDKYYGGDQDGGQGEHVATLQLKRPHNWGKVKRVLHEGGDKPKPRSSKFAFTRSCTSSDLFFAPVLVL